MNRKYRKILTDILKIIISLLAVWFVLSKIDTTQLGEVVTGVKWYWLLTAAIFFILSKLISALRLNIFFRDIGVMITEKSNIKLYLLGMFYNLFLPGGIGGDGYKIWLLKKKGSQSVRKLTAAIIFDRINGMLALCFLALLIIIFIPAFGNYRYLSALAIIVMIILFRLLNIKLFPDFRNSIFITTGLSFAVQLLQVIAIIFITLSTGIHEHFTYLILIFLCSSIVAILPITIGGIGARELVFLYGSNLFNIEASQAVAISFIFFLITAVVSFSGIYYNIKKLDIQFIDRDGSK